MSPKTLVFGKQIHNFQVHYSILAQPLLYYSLIIRKECQINVYSSRKSTPDTLIIKSKQTPSWRACHEWRWFHFVNGSWINCSSLICFTKLDQLITVIFSVDKFQQDQAARNKSIMHLKVHVEPTSQLSESFPLHSDWMIDIILPALMAYYLAHIHLQNIAKQLLTTEMLIAVIVALP